MSPLTDVIPTRPLTDDIPTSPLTDDIPTSPLTDDIATAPSGRLTNYTTMVYISIKLRGGDTVYLDESNTPVRRAGDTEEALK